MKHAGPAALDRLEPLLGELRDVTGLKEKSRGAFYCRGRAFLHFHEHGDDLFADLKTGAEFERFPATTRAQRLALMRKVKAALGAQTR